MISKENQVDTGQRYQVEQLDGAILGWTESADAIEFREMVVEPTTVDEDGKTVLGDVLVITDRYAPVTTSEVAPVTPDTLVGDELFTHATNAPDAPAAD